MNKQSINTNNKDKDILSSTTGVAGLIGTIGLIFLMFGSYLWITMDIYTPIDQFDKRLNIGTTFLCAGMLLIYIGGMLNYGNVNEAEYNGFMKKQPKSQIPTLHP